MKSTYFAPNEATEKPDLSEDDAGLARQLSDWLATQKLPPGLDQGIALLHQFSSFLDDRRRQEIELTAAQEHLHIMLNGLRQGFLLLDASGICTSIYSKVCQDVFEVEPAGLHLNELLKIPNDQRQITTSWFAMLVSEVIAFEDLASLGPSHFIGAQDKQISLEFRAVRTAAGKIKAILLITTDRTDELEAKRSVEQKVLQVDRIIKFTRNRNEAFKFIEYLTQASQKISTPFAGQNSADRLDEILRLVHTIKGGAGAFLLDSLRSDMHQVEEKLQRPHSDFQWVADCLDQHIQMIRRDFAFILGDPRLSGQTRIVYRDRIDKFLSEKMTDAKKMGELFVQVALSVPATTLVQHYAGVIEEGAQQLGKKAYPLRVLSKGETYILPDPYQDVFTNLVHVFNNVIDHGIESPAERAKNGKEEHARISIQFEIKSVKAKTNTAEVKRFFITIEDDGRGIDPALMRARAEQRGVVFDPHADDHALLQLIFSPEFSTKNDYNERAGRGIGLNSLAKAVEKLNGSLNVESKLGEFCRFNIELPLIWNLATPSTSSEVLRAS
jgi:two-component system chemotaxis sensor kinase CheA